jgi:hypothetical protein
LREQLQIGQDEILSAQNADKDKAKKEPPKEDVLAALDEAGGVEYLVTQAKENPGPVLALIGKVLPTTLSTDPESPPKLVITWQSSE